LVKEKGKSQFKIRGGEQKKGLLGNRIVLETRKEDSPRRTRGRKKGEGTLAK